MNKIRKIQTTLWFFNTISRLSFFSNSLVVLIMIVGDVQTILLTMFHKKRHGQLFSKFLLTVLYFLVKAVKLNYMVGMQFFSGLM